MARAQIRRNADGTFTVRVRRMVEHVSGDKPKGELYEALLAACRSKGVDPDPLTIAEAMRGDDG